MEENKNPEQTQTQESHTDPQVSSGEASEKASRQTDMAETHA